MGVFLRGLKRPSGEEVEVEYESSIKTKTIKLESSDILSLHSDPKVIVPAPGRGKILFPLFACVVLDFATTQYIAPSGDDTLGIHWVTDYNGISGLAAISIRNALQNGAPGTFGYSPNEDDSDDDVRLFENGWLVAYNPTGDYTDGDSTAVLTIGYVIIPTRTK